MNTQELKSSETAFSSLVNNKRTACLDRSRAFVPKVLRTRTTHFTNNFTDLLIGVWKLKNPVHAGHYLSRLLFFENGRGLDNFYKIDEAENSCELCSEEFFWKRISSETYEVKKEKGIIRFPDRDTMLINENKEEFIRVR